MSESEASERPLSGVRVLDLTRVLAGPYVGRMLADLGAEVVKVEPPEGDVTRKWGRVIAGLSGYYTQQNVGKRGVCIDLKQEGGAQLVRRLACKADVLLENFRPGVMQQQGLDYATLSADNPGLIMLSVSGFGQRGPHSRRPAYAGVIQAESGMLHRQASVDGVAPVDPRISVADMNAALHGLTGLLGALFMRTRTGRGQHVDIAMFDSMLATDDYIHLALDGVDERKGVVVNEVWQAVGGPILLAGDFRWIWRCLRDTHGLADPSPPDATIEVKARCRHDAVRAFFASFDDRARLLAALDAAKLAYGEVLPTAQAVKAPSVASRGMVVDVPDRAGSTRPVIQSPYRYSAAQSGISGHAPHRGEHNRDVLRQWLGCADADIAELEQRGVLLAEQTPR